MRDPFEASRKRLEKSAVDDPLLSPADWYPHFRDFRHQVIAKTPDFDYHWLKEHRPDLYRAIESKENELDALQEARLSRVIEIMREWRDLVLKAEAERRKARNDERLDPGTAPTRMP